MHPSSRGRWLPWIARFQPRLSAETTVLAVCLFWALAANHRFMAGALADRPLGAGLRLVLALVVATTALHYLLLAPWAGRRTTRPLLTVFVLTTAAAHYFVVQLNVYLDPAMLRNVLHSEPQEARELLNLELLAHVLLLGVLPAVLLWRVQHRARASTLKALAWRLGSWVVAALVLVGSVVAVYQPLSSLMRQHKDLRYLLLPASFIWSTAKALGLDTREASGPRQVLGADAQPGHRALARQAGGKPLVVVVVLGETARAANWGLNGYPRDTTPQLAKLPVIHFAPVVSCGTNTEVSVPCMFAPVGRRDYDEKRIRGSESLLHLLNHAGVQVHWRDNQSGCKGVCEGLPQDQVLALNPPGLCADGRCLDEGLLAGLDQRLARAQGTQLLVLHQLGNHGPSYFRRYPPAFKHFTPACEQDDLQRCSQAEIVNAYDNALRYTDHVLAQLIQQLQARASQVDSAVVYVSDHGESLGENNLFLHGLPYAIAPEVQKRVPMVWWMSAGFPAAAGVDTACLRQRAQQPTAHDHLFHSLMALLDVRSSVYAAEHDLTRACHTTAP
jgi:lipid A ethanolaminephosphotransferase